MTSAHARPQRRPFLDVLRGLAVTLMVFNHTARWWLDPGVGPARDAVIYASMALAGPTFLFVVGFSLALSRIAADAAGEPVRRLAARHLRRALVIGAAGVLVNAVVFPEDPIFTGRVLVSIALAIVVALPALWILHDRGTRLALVVVAVMMFAGFGPALGHLLDWSAAHPTAARLLLREFPLFPWLGLVFLGLAVGFTAAMHEAAGRARPYAMMAAAGVGAVAGVVIHELAEERAIFHAGRDFVLNGFWTAGPATSVAIVGMVFCLTAATYAVVEVARRRLVLLTILGRSALMVYVVHLVIVIPIGHRGLGLVLADWTRYAIATLALLVLVTGLTAAWQRLWRSAAAGLARRRSRLLPRHV